VKILRGKTTATLIALFLMFAMVVSIVALPAANAQVPVHHKATHAYIGATPNPVGVGQETLIHVGITDELAGVEYGWEGLTVTVTRPDGKTETLGPFRTDPTGGTGTVYVPGQVGNYSFQTHFPAQWYNWTSSPYAVIPLPSADIWYEASDSSILTLVVQEEPLPIWPGVPLPIECWTRPIDSQLREWSLISGNWLAVPANYLAPYNDGPETAHILWAKPLETGGLAGGELGEHAFESGDAYEGKFQNSVIIAGKLYYNRYAASFMGPIQQQQGIFCVDLHTGEELWFRNNTGVSFGQVFYWDSYNYHGVFEYIWGITSAFDFATFTSIDTWNAYDAFTGEWMYSMTNVPSGSNLYGPKGEIYRYTVDLENGWMTLWNSSRVVSTQGSWGSAANTQRTFDATRGIEWNKTIPTDLPGSINAYFLDDMILGSDTISRTADLNIAGKSADPVSLWGISVKPGQEGQLLFNKKWPRPPGNLTISMGASSQEDRVFALWSKEATHFWGFNLDTGGSLWETEPQHYLDVFGLRGFIAYGRLYSIGMSGIMYCYDVKTGERLWTYSAPDHLSEVLWANDWSIRPVVVTDGKIYMGQSEHSPIDPKPRGAPFVCVNATTGEEIFRVNGLFRQTDWGGRGVIGDSIIATMDTYDLQIYAIGKGPSATMVSTSPKVSVLGSSVLVEGMVTDISPGTEEYARTARFPNGVPAVSDENMSDWMLYVYKQFERPADITGVEVVVSVLDPNNNSYEVGRTTSDDSGFFSVEFTPEVPGKYIVVASFDGSGAYYGSFDRTAISVKEAPVATPEPTPPPTSTADLYLVPGIVGIIVAIAVVGAILMLMLRKR
jgi:hypothetical protein